MRRADLIRPVRGLSRLNQALWRRVAVGVWALLALLLIALGAGGCAPIGTTPPPADSAHLTSTPTATSTDGVGSASTAATSSTVSAQVSTADRTHEYPGPPPPAERAPGAATPRGAILAFTTVYINWTARSVSRDMAALALASVGQARSMMELTAAQTAGDGELQRSGIVNHGIVEAIAPLRGQTDRYVVVTRESTTASNTDAYQGLGPAWHVTAVTVRHAGAGWVISGWQPEG